MNLWLSLVLMTVGQPQAPIEKEIVFKGAGGMELKGTLTSPGKSSAHPVAAMLLLPGSGPTDRNGNQPPALTTDLLKEISVGLASKGIATFRFDKRAAHVYLNHYAKMSAGEMSEFFKWENFVSDATDAMKMLAAQPGIDPKRVGVIGHSEGAEIALQIGKNEAGKADQPAAIVTLGGAGRTMGPILHEQIKLALDRQKAPEDVQKTYLDFIDKACAQVAKTATYPSDPPAGLGALFNSTTTRIMQAYCAIDPLELAAKYPGPVLVLNGANDTQISAERDLPRLVGALKKRTSGSVDSLVVPDASHNFKSTKDGNKDAFTGPMAPVALEKLQLFLAKVFKG